MPLYNPPSAASGPSLVKSATVAIASGVNSVTVTFASAFASANWLFQGLRVLNTVDGSPQNLFPGVITAKSASGFTVTLNADTNTINYTLEYSCAL